MNAMHRAVNTVGAAALGAALVCALAPATVADPGLKFEGGPWIPALALVSSAPDTTDAEQRSGADDASYAPLLAFLVEPEDLDDSASALKRTLSEADSAPVAIPARVSIEPAPGEADSPAEDWAPAVLVIAKADVEPPATPRPVRSEQADAGQDAWPSDETARWVPAFGITSGIITQGTQGSVDSHFLPSGEDVRPPVDGGVDLLSPWMGASLELMTPSPGELPGRPRFFLHGDVGLDFGFGRSVAKEGAPGPFVPPDTRPPITVDAVVEGQGSETSAEPRLFMAGAGAGIAFTLDAMGRRIRIKPSVEYMQEQLDIVGVVHRALIVDPGVAGRPNQGIPDIPPTYQFVTLQGSQRETYHGVGAGLEVETDGGRAGPLVLTLFVSGQAYRILGNRTTQFTQVADDTIDGVPEATWSFTKDAWTYRAGVGMRFRWQPAE